jgi:hypothetical protein
MQYVPTLRAGPHDDLTELGAHLPTISGQLSVLIVAGSPPQGFTRNAHLFAGLTHSGACCEEVRRMPASGSPARRIGCRR